MKQGSVRFLVGGDCVFVVTCNDWGVLEQTKHLQMGEIWRHHRG